MFSVTSLTTGHCLLSFSAFLLGSPRNQSPWGSNGRIGHGPCNLGIGRGHQVFMVSESMPEAPCACMESQSAPGHRWVNRRSSGMALSLKHLECFKNPQGWVPVHKSNWDETHLLYWSYLQYSSFVYPCFSTEHQRFKTPTTWPQHLVLECANPGRTNRESCHLNQMRQESSEPCEPKQCLQLVALAPPGSLLAMQDPGPSSRPAVSGLPWIRSLGDSQAQ